MMYINKTLTFIITLILSGVAFAQRVTQEDIYGEYGGGDAGLFGYVGLLVFAGLIIWGVITNKGFRLGVIGYVAYLSSIIFMFKVFGKEWGIVACAISVVILLINDPAFKKNKDSSAINKASDLNKEKTSQAKPNQDVVKSMPATSFDNSNYPEPKSNVAISNNQTPKIVAESPLRATLNEQLTQGNIKCSSCGYQDLPKNFLPSDAGGLYRKCPKCNANWQVLSAFNMHGEHKCTGCGLPGDKGAFFPSSAGKEYLLCSKCNTHFQK